MAENIPVANLDITWINPRLFEEPRVDAQKELEEAKQRLLQLSQKQKEKEKE